MNRWLKMFLEIVVVIAVPIVLIVMPIRVMMHPRWVYWEYGRPDFAPDQFGFTTAERTRLALVGVDSIIGPRGVVVLEEARLPDGSPAFNAREVSHMLDVRVVTGNLYFAQVVLLIALVAALIVLARNPATRMAAPSGLLKGGLLAVALLIGMVLFVWLGFDVFFTTFHRVFFTGDTWLFNFSDTLIRLYPPQFWFDVATAIGVATLVEAIVVSVIAWRWARAWSVGAAR